MSRMNPGSYVNLTFSKYQYGNIVLNLQNDEGGSYEAEDHWYLKTLSVSETQP